MSSIELGFKLDDAQVLAVIDKMHWALPVGFFYKAGSKPKADVEVGLADSTAVILANLAMDEGRRVYFNEIDKMGKGAPSRRS